MRTDSSASPNFSSCWRIGGERGGAFHVGGDCDVTLTGCVFVKPGEGRSAGLSAGQISRRQRFRAVFAEDSHHDQYLRPDGVIESGDGLPAIDQE